ncbi:MAG: WD40 repeat domain-containing protein [Gemmataceae bacterium]|nr:WD40 repeat domain-containing protein [Gemmataceae bacterium]
MIRQVLWLGGAPAALAVVLALLPSTPAPAQAPQGKLDKAALLYTIRWDADWVTAVTFAGPTRKMAAGNKLGQILVWDLPENPGPTPPPVLRLDGHSNAVTGLAATPDGRWLISSSYDHTVRLWDLQQPAKGTATVVLQGASSKKKKAATKPAEFKVGVLGPAKTLTAHREWIRSLSLTPDGKHLLTGDDRGLAILWAVPEGKELSRLEGRGWLQAVALLPDASLAVTCAYAPRYAQFPNALRLWDATTGKEKLDLGPQFKRGQGVAGMGAAAFSPDGKLLALGQGGEVESGKAKVFVLTADGKKRHELPGHMHGVTALAFHPEGRYLASSGRESVVRLWNSTDGRAVQELGKSRGGQFRDWIHSIAFSPDGRLLAAADMAGMVHVWSFAPRSPVTP